MTWWRSVHFVVVEESVHDAVEESIYGVVEESVHDVT